MIAQFSGFPQHYWLMFSGVVATLFFLCLSYLWKDVKHGRGKARWLLAYAATLFVLCSIVSGINMRFDELSYIDNRNFPGGPAECGIQENGIFINLFGTAVSFACSWLQDGLLVCVLHNYEEVGWNSRHRCSIGFISYGALPCGWLLYQQLCMSSPLVCQPCYLCRHVEFTVT